MAPEAVGSSPIIRPKRLLKTSFVIREARFILPIYTTKVSIFAPIEFNRSAKSS